MEILLYIGVTLLGVYLLLAIGNQPYGQRWKQYWIPFIGLLMVLLAIYEYYIDVDYLIRQGEFLPIFQGYTEIMYSLLLIGIFGIVKLITNEGSRIFSKKKTAGQIPVLPKFSIAYKTDEKGGIVIRKEWVFTGLYAKYLAWIVLGMFLILFALKILSDRFDIHLINLPALCLFALFLILEIHWYLSHPRIEEQPEPPAQLPEKTTIPNDYLQLWFEYQKIWEDKKLLSWSFAPPKEKVPAPTTVDIIEATSLMNIGYNLTLDDYDILQNLVNKNDMLIDDVVLDEVAPLLFSVFLRRLMDGENILVITSKRCYPNSKYHQQIVDWINSWIFRLTGNREFFRVHTFSRLEDVGFTSRIIVTSAEDILEKNIIGHSWFSNLQTILFLNGDEIFSEALTSNNILLNILKNKFDKIQSIVLADYREALQASVMHNLEVKRNLREVRMRHSMSESAFVLFWKLEGNSWFQHKLLTGHIERFLGAEAVLALIARREQISDIRFANHEKLPYYEYIEETDNNVGSLIPSIVAPRTLQTKGTNVIQCSAVGNLMAVGTNTFLLVRDAEFNLVTALRKWQVYAKENLFLHIASPPYLLREFFVQHIEYFWRTPLYALSSKRMTSRFEVARTLLERLVVDELSESQILQAIVWINPNAVFVKQELQTLIRLAFDIDIVASNYLTIRSIYEHDRETDSFKQVNLYKLLPRIKEDLNLFFLKKIEIVQGVETVHVISFDLLFQNYLPSQIHSFDGKSCMVKGYDRLNYKMLVNSKAPVPVLAYHPDLEVTLYRLDEPLNDSQRKILLKKITLELCEGAFDVKTNGYLTFNTDISLMQDAHTYTAIVNNEVPVRQYKLGRAMILSVEIPEDGNLVKLTATFTVLLTEVMRSLYPETYHYLIIGSPVNQLAFKGKFAQLFSSISVKDQQPDLTEKIMQICIFEDAHQDLGLVQSIYDNWDYILRVLDDYLVWLLEVPPTTGKKLFDLGSEDKNMLQKSAFKKENYLKYGFDKHPEFLDLEGASKLLRNLLGTNHMTTQRNNFYKV